MPLAARLLPCDNRPMTWYSLTLVVKFLALLTYAGGVVAAFVASNLDERRRAVHDIASPALFVMWCAGYGLVLQSGLGLFELWTTGGLVLSLVSNFALVFSVARGRQSRGALLAVTVPLVVAVVLMVRRPTWSELFP